MNKRVFLKMIGAILLLLLLLDSGCTVSDDLGMTFNNQTEQDVLSKVLSIRQSATLLWPGYDLLNQNPIVVIFPDLNGEDQFAYILNVDDPPPGSVLIKNELGPSIYRNDDLFLALKDSFNNGIPLFVFDFVWHDKSYFVAKHLVDSNNPYIAYKFHDNNGVSLLLAHELFHKYQFANWSMPMFNNDYFGFPQTKEIIELSLLLFKLGSDAYHLTPQGQRKFLEQYIGIRAKQIELDPSLDLVALMATSTERVEGSARYVEHFAALNTIYPKISDDPTHSFQSQIDTVTQNENLARQILVQRVPYHVGAIVIKILNDNGYDVFTAMKSGQTPYSMARSFINGSDDNYTKALEEAKLMADWAFYQTRASQLEQLLN